MIPVIRKNISILFFILFFFVGILNLNTFGINWDSEAQRRIGFFNGNHILKSLLSDDSYKKIFKSLSSNFDDQTLERNNKDFENYSENAYGAIFELFSASVETFLDIDDFYEIFKLRHYLNFLYYYLSLIFFYKFLFKLTKNNFFSLIGVFLLFFNPRIFADSFYNSKDIIFMSSLMISNYYGLSFLKKYKLKNFILFCFFTGFGSAIRIIGLINIPVYIFISFFIFNNKKLSHHIKITLISLLFFYVLYPYIWIDPFQNFLNSIIFFSNHRLNVEVLYFGELYNSQNMPWHYLITWIFISNPSMIILLFILSYFFIFFEFIKKKEINIPLIFNTIFIFIPLLLVALLGSTLYDGWRQFFFIYPYMVVSIIYSLNKIYELIIKKNYKLFIKFLIILKIIFLIHIFVKSHPYQYLFFNNLISNPLSKFDKDYWGLSNKDLINLISKNYKGNIYYDFYGSNFKSSVKFQNVTDSQRYIHIKKSNDDIKSYLFFLNNRFLSQDDIKILRKNLNPIHEIIVKDTYINGVYEIKLE